MNKYITPSRVRVRSDRISEIMRSIGLDVTGLAYHAGISPDYVYKIVRGERPNISAINLASIARVLGVSIEYLLGMVDEPETDKLIQNIHSVTISDDLLVWLHDKIRELAYVTSKMALLNEITRLGVCAYFDSELKLIDELVSNKQALDRIGIPLQNSAVDPV